MPYIKPKDMPFRSISMLLKGYDITATRLAEILDCSWNTAKKRIETPGTFTLEELWRVSQKGHVPIDSLRQAFVRNTQ